MKQVLFRFIFIILFVFLFAAILFFPGQSESSSAQIKINVAASSQVQKQEHKTVKIKKTGANEIEPQDEIKFQNLTPEQTNQPEEASSDVNISIETEGSQTEKIYDLNEDSSGAIVAPVIDLASVYKKIIYPPSMMRHNIETAFEVKVYVDASGAVRIEIPNDVDPQFKNSVEAAFRNLKAEPATIAGAPVSVVFAIPIQFKLK